MKRVITYGTFDLLHYGHINLLKRAKEEIWKIERKNGDGRINVWLREAW